MAATRSARELSWSRRSLPCWRWHSCCLREASPQSGLLHQGKSLFFELPHALDVARPGQNDAVESGALQHGEAVDHLLLGADERIAGPSGDEMLLERLQDRRWNRQRIEPHGVDQVLDAHPVAFVKD